MPGIKWLLKSRSHSQTTSSGNQLCSWTLTCVVLDQELVERGTFGAEANATTVARGTAATLLTSGTAYHSELAVLVV